MIGHDIAAALPELRAQAESLMSDCCSIDRAASVWDEVAQKSVTTWTPVHAGVPCRLSRPPAASRSLLTGEAVTAEAPIVKVPWTCEGIEPDDRVTLCDGRVAWVSQVPVYDDQVQRRLVCRWVR